STMAKVSEINATAYKTFVRPWVRSFVTQQMADALTALHPLRMQRQLLSAANPRAGWTRQGADWARNERQAAGPDHPLRAAEREISDAVERQYDAFRDTRDRAIRAWARWFYGPHALGALLPPDPPDEALAVARAQGHLAYARRDALRDAREGGFP